MPVTRRTDDGCRWHVLPEWESLLLAPGGLPLTRWLADGRAQAIWNRAGRSIYLVRLGDRAVCVKQHRSDGLVTALANLVRGSAARREWNGAIEALRRGVPTAQPVAFGEQRTRGWPRASTLVTQLIDGAEPLNQLVRDRIEPLASARRQVLRRRAVDRVARLVAAVHEAGLRHPDFHAGNLLVVPDELEAPGRLGVWLIDLAGARFSGPLDWAAARADLVVLHAEWFDRLSVAERWRFFWTYVKYRPRLQIPPRDVVVDQLDRGARAHSRRIDRRRDRRALRVNRDFLVLRRPGRRLHGARELPDAVLEQLVERPDAAIFDALDRPIKISHTTLMVRAEWSSPDGSISAALKRCRPRGVWKSFLDRFRRSRAMRGWYYGHALAARRIATARPLAVCDARRWHGASNLPAWLRWFVPRESYLAVEWLEGAENLHLWTWRWAQRPDAERLRRAARCAESLGRLLGRMHARRVSHRDLKASNLLVADAGDEVRTWLVDTDGVRIHRRLSARRRAADLARLATSVAAHPWVSRTVLCRFLRAYAAEFSRGSIDKRLLWRAVERRARRQIARRKRQGKPLL